MKNSSGPGLKAPGHKDAGKQDDGSQEDEREAQAVRAEIEMDAETFHPGDAFDELHAADATVVQDHGGQCQAEGKDGSEKRNGANHAPASLRHEQEKKGADERGKDDCREQMDLVQLRIPPSTPVEITTTAMTMAAKMIRA